MISQTDLAEIVATKKQLEDLQAQLKARLEAGEEIENGSDPSTSFFAQYDKVITDSINYTEFVKKLSSYAEQRDDKKLVRWVKDTLSSMSAPRISSRRSFWVGITSLRPPTTMKEFEIQAKAKRD